MPFIGSLLPNQLINHVDVILEILSVADNRRVFADLVESLGSDRLHCAPHDRVVIED